MSTTPATPPPAAAPSSRHAAFYRVSGAGNDFIALVEPSEPPGAALVRAWCRRGLSLGSDGLFTLERNPHGARMVHWNADGGRSELCLNGSRCAAQLAFHLGWHESTLVLETDAGSLVARAIDASKVGLELPPISSRPVERTLEADGAAWTGWSVSVGVPHFVLAWPESLATAPVAELGASLRAHPDLGAAGANVNFVRFVGPDHFEIRSFERGVEAETLACGTGVVATAVAATAAGRLDLPATALTAGGFELAVTRTPQEHLELAGDARVVARGELLPGATALPSAARWS